MKNRDEFDNTPPVRAKMSKKLYESDKAFDESMESLITWLNRSMQVGYLTQDETIKIFRKNLRRVVIMTI